MLMPASGDASAAAARSLILSTDEPVLMRGATQLVAETGSLVVKLDAHTGEYELEGVHGELEVHTWKSSRVEAPLVLEWGEDVEKYETTRYPLANATLRLTFADEPVRYVAIPEGGRTTLSGETSSASRAYFLDRDIGSISLNGTTLHPSPPSADWAWSTGWAFSGEYFDKTALRGHPTWVDPPLARLQGAHAIELEAGRLEFMAESGVVAVRLGNWSEGPGGFRNPGLGAQILVENRARAILHATQAEGSLPTGGDWGMAAPTMAIEHDGVLRWTQATGSADGKPFGPALVEVNGTATVASFSASTLLEERVRYEAVGDWGLRVNGHAVAPPARVDPRPPLMALAAAVLVLLARKWIALLVPGYSRIPPRELLRSPIRMRIYEAVCQSPGLHLRELNRRVGGGWGAFRLHLAALEKGGYLRVQRAGRQRLVYPSSSAPDAVDVHPTGRLVLDGLTGEDAMSLRDLAAKTGLSRQLVKYHVNRLAEMGKLSIAGSGRMARITLARPPAPRDEAAGTRLRQ